MKKYLIISFLILLGLSFKSQALADIAPPTPAYPNTHLDVKVGLDSLADKYVVIRHSIHYVEVYSLVTDSYVGTTSYASTTYFALDKNYFESHGGIDGLFLTIGVDEGVVMSPKDSEDLNAHIYNFVISKNDPLINWEFNNRGDEVVNDEYIKFPFRSDFYIREGQDDSDCETGFEGNKDCRVGEKTLTYSPQQVIGNNIVLVNSENLNQPETSPTEVSVLPQHLPWYVRLWNFIKSLF